MIFTDFPQTCNQETEEVLRNLDSASRVPGPNGLSQLAFPTACAPENKTVSLGRRDSG